MRNYDLCLSWYWPYDCDFVHHVEDACGRLGLTLWQVTPAGILQAVTDLYGGKSGFGSLLDRAQDDLRFEPLRRFALEHGLHRINPPELSHWSEDKATMHLELIQAGLQTPYTILFSPFVDQPLLPGLDLSPLGSKFVLKPAVGGGGEGVILNCCSPDDIQRARMEFPDQKYLAQEYVEARLIDGRAAWFRIFYVGGDCIPCWWNQASHAYSLLTPQDEMCFGLGALRSITDSVAKVCRLDWFSTEIAQTPGGRFVVVDYVNDGIDLRVQSKASDGVPDEVVKRIAEGLVAMAVSRTK